MISDLRRKLISILRADTDATDAQLLEHARNVVANHDWYRSRYLRSWGPQEKPAAALRTVDVIVERDSTGRSDVPGVWTIDTLTFGEDGIEISASRQGSHDVLRIVKRPMDTVLVLAPLPERDGVELLAEELGARMAGEGS